jgi:UDP-N-acetylglucosamine transferase subunit ALG13
MAIPAKNITKSRLWGIVILILVMLGTNPYSFLRLAEAADAYAGKFGEKMFIQLGNTPYVPQNSDYKKFLGKKELLDKIQESDVVITQGGFGSIADSLLAHKKVVAVPRKPELNEAPDRQEDLVRELEKLGRVVGVYSIDKLAEAINRARVTKVNEGNKHSISRLIDQFIATN